MISTEIVSSPGMIYGLVRITLNNELSSSTQLSSQTLEGDSKDRQLPNVVIMHTVRRWSPPEASCIVNSSVLDPSNYFSLKVCSKFCRRLEFASPLSLTLIFPPLYLVGPAPSLYCYTKSIMAPLDFPPNVLLPDPTPTSLFSALQQTEL